VLLLMHMCIAANTQGHKAQLVMIKGTIAAEQSISHHEQ